MVCFAIVARLDPAQSRGRVAVISQNSADLLRICKQFTEFWEIIATPRLLCAGSRRVTIAKQTIFQNFRIWAILPKRN